MADATNNGVVSKILNRGRSASAALTNSVEKVLLGRSERIDKAYGYWWRFWNPKYCWRCRFKWCRKVPGDRLICQRTMCPCRCIAGDLGAHYARMVFAPTKLTEEDEQIIAELLRGLEKKEKGL